VQKLVCVNGIYTVRNGDDSVDEQVQACYVPREQFLNDSDRLLDMIAHGPLYVLAR
jgi:hypothetical protein